MARVAALRFAMTTTPPDIPAERSNNIMAGTRTITAEIWGETYELRANWADAASSIESEREGDWCPTGYQVADFSHSDTAAMR